MLNHQIPQIPLPARGGSQVRAVLDVRVSRFETRPGIISWAEFDRQILHTLDRAATDLIRLHVGDNWPPTDGFWQLPFGRHHHVEVHAAEPEVQTAWRAYLSAEVAA